MPAAQGLYGVLELEYGVDDAAIKNAYRRLARRWHPGSEKGDPVRFRAIQEAYETLRDPLRRSQYDASLGFGAPTTIAKRGDDLRVDITISLEAASSGGAFETTYQRTGPCDLCEGSRCTRCRNTRIARSQRTLSVAVPAGIEDGARLRIASEGDAGTGGEPSGDLLVVVRVGKHDRYRRAGRDLFLELAVPFGSLALGGPVAVPTLAGDPVAIELESGAPVGTVRRVVGLGMPSIGAPGRGDLYVTLTAEVPRFLTPEAREALARYSELEAALRR
jgi:DnaJ-class molecular chaperone